MNILLRHPFAIGLTSLLLGLINSLTLQSSSAGFLCISVYLACVALLFETRFVLHVRGMGIPIACAVLMITGSALYYAGPVTTVGLLAIGLLPLGLAFKKPLGETPTFIPAPMPRAPLYTGLALTAITVYTFSQYAFDVAVRSPWDSIPVHLFLLPFLLLALLAIHATLYDSRETAPLFSLLLFLALMITPLVYRLGYGFDPFIHRATIGHILEYGTITPKPLYYIGQYALELLGTRIFGIPLDVFDTWLVPLLASILLPYAFTVISGNKKYGILALLIIPLAPFIFTTPQSLSYVFFALTIAASAAHLRREDEHAHRPPYVALLLALGTLSIHPLSGIPAVLAVILAWVTRIQHSVVRATAFTLSAAGMMFAIPALFIAQSVLQNTPIALQFQWPNMGTLLPDLTNHFAGWLDLLYMYPRIFVALIAILLVMGFFALRKSHESALATWSAAGTLSLLMAYLILSSAFEFSFLIESERANYANRLPYLALLMSTPLLAQAFMILVNHMRQRPASIPAGIMALAVLGTSTAYASFPRNDGETRSAGFNVSASDYEAAASIHSAYAMGTYTVLANQSLSAAALKAYGFAHYFNDDVFYYPIPTGGPLYELFLRMSNTKTSRETAQQAFELTGAQHVVFVSHAYWSGADAAREQAKREADKWYTVGSNGEIMIFLYDFANQE